MDQPRINTPWKPQQSYSGNLVSLSNSSFDRKFSSKKKLQADRYVTEDSHKCLIKAKLNFDIIGEQNNGINLSGKASKVSNYQFLLNKSFKPILSKQTPLGMYSSKFTKKVPHGFGEIYERLEREQLIQSRCFPKSSYKVLNAPNLKDDFYTSLLDWSKQDLITVVLNNAAYMWSSSYNEAQKILQGNISSIKWGRGLVVGQECGTIRVIDVDKKIEVHKTKNHLGRVGALDISFTGNQIVSGSKDSEVIVWDTRQQTISALYEGHKQEICGVKWSFNNHYIASGGNDNLVMIWDTRMNKLLKKLTQHTAAVKALAWSPHQENQLATGGGSTDRSIKIWDISSMSCTKSIDTGSQVCNMTYSERTNELVSTHGYSLNSVVVWDAKTMRQLTSLQEHSYRVLYLAKSPNAETILTGSGDQTLRFWKLFPEGKSQTAQSSHLESESCLLLR